MGPPRLFSLVSLARAVCGAGLITLFFSEFLFFNEGPALAVIYATSVLDAISAIGELVFYYLYFASILSAALSYFCVRSWEGLVLAGSLFGWAVEGTVIAAVYEAVPLSFLWTAVGWHMGIDVALGLVALPILLRMGWARAFAASVLLGLFWACWSTWVWPDGPRIPPQDFTPYALLTGTLLVTGLCLLCPVLPALWSMPRPIALGVAGLTAPLFLLSGSAHPVRMGVLAGLIALSLWALSRLLRTDAEEASLVVHPVPPLRVVALLPAPLVASATYAALWDTEVVLATPDVILFLLFSSFCIFLLSLWRAFTTA